MDRRRPGRSRRSRRRRHPFLWAGLVVALLLALGVFMAVQAFSAYSHLHRAQALLGQLRAQTLAGDAAAGQVTLDKLASETSAAHDSLSGPHWWVAAHAPWVGDDITAVRTVSTGVDTLTHEALPQLLDAARAAYPRAGSFKGGKVDLATIQRARPHLRRALPSLRAVDGEAQKIDPSGLNTVLQRPVSNFVDAIASLRGGTEAAATAARVLPGMLGADGPRTYLILNQNTAEQRMLGGIPGSVLLARASHGKVELVRTSSASAVGAFDRPVVPLTEAEQTLHGEVLAEYMANVTDVPDFARGAYIARTMWAKRYGEKVDGVIATDPYALQLILGAVGPVRTDNGAVLTRANAAQVLLHQAYLKLPPAAQDAFFASAARAVFEKVTSGVGNPRALVSALGESVRQHRVLMWSAHPSEQRDIAGFQVAGTWPAAHPPELGVFLHDRTQSKMSWYQHASVRVDCMDDVGAFHARVTIRSTAPANAASLPISVTGNGSRIARGKMWTQLLVSAPPGWTIQDWKARDGDNAVAMMRADGSWTATRDFRLAPGTVGEVEFTLQPAQAAKDLGVRITPGTTPRNTDIRVSRCAR